MKKIRYDYIFYTTDESFDYGDGTCYCIGEHGFSIEIDSDNNVFINSLEAYGDYAEMNDITTLAELKQYLIEHKEESQLTKQDCIDELVSFIDDNLKSEGLL